MKMLLLLTAALFVLTGVSAAANCDNLEKEPVAEVIAGCTTSIKSTKNYRLVVDASVDSAKWETFTKTIQTIDGVNVIIENSPIAKLTFPALTKISSPNGDFIINNNQQLTEVSITVAQEMSQQNFKIENNPKLTTLTLPIPSVKIGKDFVVAGNSAMTQMGMSSITTFNAGNLLVMKNMALNYFKLDYLQSIEISEHVTFKKNDNLEKIYIGHIDSDPVTFTLPQLIVMQNTKLTGVTGYFKNTHMKVHGNPKLNQAELEKLKTKYRQGNDIQPEGECVFDEKINSLGELKICKIVGSDLELADNIQGNSGGINIAEITGKINLGNAKPDQVNFLQNTKTIGGSITSSDCTFPATLFGHPVVIQPASPCPTTATTDTTKATRTTEEKPTAGPTTPGGEKSGGQSPSEDNPASSQSEGSWTLWQIAAPIVCAIVAFALGALFMYIIGRFCCKKKTKNKDLEKGGNKKTKGGSKAKTSSSVSTPTSAPAVTSTVTPKKPGSKDEVKQGEEMKKDETMATPAGGVPAGGVPAGGVPAGTSKDVAKNEQKQNEEKKPDEKAPSKKSASKKGGSKKGGSKKESKGEQKGGDVKKPSHEGGNTALHELEGDVVIQSREPSRITAPVAKGKVKKNAKEKRETVEEKSEDVAPAADGEKSGVAPSEPPKTDNDSRKQDEADIAELHIGLNN